MAGLILCNATVRVSSGAGGLNTPKPYPGSSKYYSPSLTVTAPSCNAGTIYVSTSSSASTATGRETSMVKLTQGQSFTFTGVPRGTGGFHDIVFGTGYSYIHASATSQRAVITYYKWD